MLVYAYDWKRPVCPCFLLAVWWVRPLHSAQRMAHPAVCIIRDMRRVLIPLVVACIAGRIGVLPVLVFWPLLFPERLDGTAAGDNFLLLVCVVAFLVFAVPAYYFTWKFLDRRQSSGRSNDEQNKIVPK